jgi:oxygen-independent coproporphyrinogen-3 oxidase
MGLPPLGLYIHLPWCERKCPYCDFNSHETDSLPEGAYIDALIEDLGREIRDERRPIETIFIGGGTPSLFSVAGISRLMDSIRELTTLATDAEITMEANPGSVERARLAGYAQAGITRFSLGIQSFDDNCLTALGRVHNAAAASAAVAAARQTGIKSFNIDLMHGLPRQNLTQGLADIRTALALEPPHLSWYQLTIEPNTRFYSDTPILPSENILGSLEEQGTALLEAAGYRRYEVSAWARPGQECRHNLNYWRFGDYLAIGAGAHGKVSFADGRVMRYAKTRRPEDYLAPHGTARKARRYLSDEDKRGEFMLNALRLEAGFSLALFEARTGLPADSLKTRLGRLSDQGLLELDADEGIVRCTALGWRFLDDVVGHFFTEPAA